MTDSAAQNCSTEMVQIILEASSVVVDPTEVEALAASSGLLLPRPNQAEAWSWQDFQNLSVALKARYGQLGARGTALKVGRAAFQGVVRTYGNADGFEEPQYQL
ncbi:hypothetical protein EG834_03840, partial [bacterium]|nr:hypothetical protein [bacterium]